MNLGMAGDGLVNRAGPAAARHLLVAGADIDRHAAAEVGLHPVAIRIVSVASQHRASLLHLLQAVLRIVDQGVGHPAHRAPGFLCHELHEF